MAELNVTQTLRDTIKKYRKSIHLRGDVLSRTLHKNTSYISQLETGKLQTIDSDLLYKIFDELFKDETPENKNNKIEEILDQLQLSLSDKELEHQSWMRVMDLQYRLIPIPETILEYIEKQLAELNITPEELVCEINKNSSLYESFSPEEIDSMEDNKVYAIYTHDQKVINIKFNLPLTYITDILKKKIIKCNFITLQSIIYNIYVLKGMDFNQAYDQSETFLFENKFYTLLWKQHFAKNSPELAPYDLEFQKYLDQLVKIFSKINDHQPGFLNDILQSFIKNIKKEPVLTFSILNKDISSLNKMSDANKKNFIEDFKSLIKQYENNSVQTTKKLKTF